MHGLDRYARKCLSDPVIVSLAKLWTGAPMGGQDEIHIKAFARYVSQHGKDPAYIAINHMVVAMTRDDSEAFQRAANALWRNTSFNPVSVLLALLCIAGAVITRGLLLPVLGVAVWWWLVGSRGNPVSELIF